MDSRLSITGEIAGAPLNASINRSADTGIRHGPITLPAAEAGTLSTRTTDTTGVLTITDTALEIGDVIDIYWDGGMRYDVDVDNVVAAAVTFSGGAGDVLPTQDDPITAAEQVVIDTDFDGANLVAIGALCTQRGHLSFQESDATELSVELTASEPWFWVDAQEIANPLVGTVVGNIQVSQASSTATAALNVGILYDSTP